MLTLYILRNCLGTIHFSSQNIDIVRYYESVVTVRVLTSVVRDIIFSLIPCVCQMLITRDYFDVSLRGRERRCEKFVFVFVTWRFSLIILR